MGVRRRPTAAPRGTLNIRFGERWTADVCRLPDASGLQGRRDGRVGLWGGEGGGKASGGGTKKSGEGG